MDHERFFSLNCGSFEKEFKIGWHKRRVKRNRNRCDEFSWILRTFHVMQSSSDEKNTNQILNGEGKLTWRVAIDRKNRCLMVGLVWFLDLLKPHVNDSFKSLPLKPPPKGTSQFRYNLRSLSNRISILPIGATMIELGELLIVQSNKCGDVSRHQQHLWWNGVRDLKVQTSKLSS